MRSLAFFLSSCGVALVSACSAGSNNLGDLQADIISDFKTVAHMPAEDFLALDPAKTRLLDIREPEEYGVSRLPGAIWVSPDIDAESALIQIGDVTGKHIVVYCSVGVRSSRFAERTQNELRKMGAISVSNLEQGIFGWHNDQRALINAKGKTDAVHPYDAKWKRYLKRKHMARLSP